MISSMSDVDTENPAELPAHRLRRQQEPPRAAIIGAGPLGLEAALYALRLGHQVWLFERDAEIAPDVRAWAHVAMFTPWAMNRSPLGVLMLREAAHKGKTRKPAMPSKNLSPTGAEFIAAYLQPVAALLRNVLLCETRVVAVGRSYLFPEEHADQPEKRGARRFRLLTRSPLEERIFTADYVIDATGVSHTPRWLGAGGLPALGEMGGSRQIHYQIPDALGRDRINFLGRRTLLVGDGTSAATTAVAIADLLNLDPTGSLLWVSKSRAEMPLAMMEKDPLPRRDTLLKKANLLIKKPHPRIEYLPVTQVEAVQHSLATDRFQVTLQVNHETKRFTVDSVVGNVGFRRDAVTYERALHPQEPGLYVIGAKAGDGGDFFLPDGRQQIRDAFRQITKQPDLDLYAEAQAKLDGI